MRFLYVIKKKKRGSRFPGLIFNKIWGFTPYCSNGSCVFQWSSCTHHLLKKGRKVFSFLIQSYVVLLQSNNIPIFDEMLYRFHKKCINRRTFYAHHRYRNSDSSQVVLAFITTRHETVFPFNPERLTHFLEAFRVIHPVLTYIMPL